MLGGVILSNFSIVKAQEVQDLLVQGQQLLSSGSYQQAQKTYTLAATKLASSQDSQLYLEALNGLVRVSVLQHDFSAADSLLSLSFALAQNQQLTHEHWFSKTLAERGYYYDQKGDYPAAQKDYLQAIELASNSPDSIWIANLYNRMGRVEGLAGNLEGSDQYSNQALEIIRRHEGDQHLEAAVAYSNLGNNLKDRGDYAQAKNYFEEALRIRQQLLGSNSPEVADSYINIGTANYYLQDYDEAEKYYRKALKDYQRILGPQTIKVAYANMNIGIIHAMRNENLKALDYFIKERKIKESVYGNVHPDLIYSYNNVSFIYQRLQDLDKSLEMHEKALEISHKVYGDRHYYLAQTYDNIAYVYQLQGEYDTALAYVQKGLIAGTYRFSNLDILQNPEADDYLNPAELLRMYRRKAELFEAKAGEAGVEELTLALDQIFSCIDLLGHMRNTYRAEGSKILWQGGVKAQVEKGVNLAYKLYQLTKNDLYLEKAFELFESSKSAVLLSAINQDKALELAGIPQEQIDLEAEFQQALRAAEKRSIRSSDSLERVVLRQAYFQQKVRYDSLINQLEQTYPKYTQIKTATNTVPLKTFQQGLKSAQQNCITYFLGDTSMYALHIQKDDISFVQLSGPQEITQAVQSFREEVYGYFLQDAQSDSLFQAHKNSFIHKSNSLYRTLLAPLGTDIGNTSSSTLIIPDGALGYLPFEILLKSLPNNNAAFNGLPYFIESTNISYAYSASLLHATKRKIKAGNNALVLAPKFPASSSKQYASIENRRRNNLGPLAFNVKEAQGIEEILPARVLTGSDASLPNFQAHASDYAILHFATHGKVDEDAPALSFLALAAQNPESSYEKLFLHDLYDMELNAELVVLSACETGLGPLNKGEGIASMSRAFSYAGAQSLVATLWAVNDGKTAELMDYFYQGLHDKLPKDEALRLAKLKYLNQNDAYYSHPYFWAGPVAQGNMRPLGSGSNFPFISSLVLLIITLILVGVWLQKYRSKTS